MEIGHAPVNAEPTPGIARPTPGRGSAHGGQRLLAHNAGRTGCLQAAATTSRSCGGGGRIGAPLQHPTVRRPLARHRVPGPYWPRC